MFTFSDPLPSTLTGEVLISRSVTGLEALHWSSQGNILVTVSTSGSLGFRSRTLGQALSPMARLISFRQNNDVSSTNHLSENGNRAITEQIPVRFNNSFEKEVELNQILPSTGGSKVSVTVHNNLMYFSNGLSLTLLEIPRMFNDSHFLPDLLLLKADVMLKAISYPYLFEKGRFKKEYFIQKIFFHPPVYGIPYFLLIFLTSSPRCISTTTTTKTRGRTGTQI